MAEKQTLEMYRGDSKVINVRFGANASMLLNGTVWLTLKTKKDNIECGDPNSTCVFQTFSPITTVTGTGGAITGYESSLYIPPAKSKLFSIVSYFYDIQAVGDADDPNNPGNPLIVKTLIEGVFKIAEDVTIKTS